MSFTGTLSTLSTDSIRSQIETKRREAYARADQEAQKALEALQLLESLLGVGQVSENENTPASRTEDAKATATANNHRNEASRRREAPFPMKLWISDFVSALPEDRIISQRTVYDELFMSFPHIRTRTEKSVRSQITAILNSLVEDGELHVVRDAWAGKPAEYSKNKLEGGTLLGGMEE